MAFLARLGRSHTRQLVRAFAPEQTASIRLFSSDPSSPKPPDFSGDRPPLPGSGAGSAPPASAPPPAADQTPPASGADSAPPASASPPAAGQTPPASGAGNLAIFGGAADDDDIVLQTFKEQSKAYRDVLEGMKDIEVPLNLEPEAVKKYAEQMEALKSKAGMPDRYGVMDAKIRNQLLIHQGDARKFFKAAVSDLGLEDNPETQKSVEEILAELDKVRAEYGGSEEKAEEGAKVFEKFLREYVQSKGAGEENIQALEKAHTVAVYEDVIASAVEETQELIENVQTRQRQDAGGETTEGGEAVSEPFDVSKIENFKPQL